MSNNDVDTIIKLLRQTTSLAIVKDFLKNKDLHHSASSWDELREKRISPALDSKQLSKKELIDLLRQAEEHGRQHIFLYKCPAKKAQDLMDRNKIEHALKKKGLDSLLTTPTVLDQPSEPTISDIRWEGDTDRPSHFTVKIVEQRISHVYLEESEENGFFIKRYEKVKERAVNIARLHRNGSLEIRITSHSNSSKYHSDVNKIIGQLSDIIDLSGFTEVSLYQLKNKLWDDRASLGGIIKYSDSTLRNNLGTVLKAATGDPNCNLIDDTGADSSLETFMSHDAYCDSSNIWLIKNEPLPSKDIHILLSGEVNEFAITAHCNQLDYEHALNQLQKLNS